MMQKQYMSSHKVFNHEIVVKIIYTHSAFLIQSDQLIHSKKHLFSEKLTVQLAKKFPTFYATPKVITILTSNHHFSLS